MPKLTVSDFANLFGVMPDELDASLIESRDFSYQKLNKRESNEIVLQVLKRLDSGELDASNEARQVKWEAGWRENLDAFKERGLGSLIPKYFRAGQPLRLYQEYIKPKSSEYELDFFTVLRSWLFTQYLKDAKAIYEFGCGPGYNLVLLANMFIHKKLIGLDWAKSAVELVNLIGLRHYENIHGRLFNMYCPDRALRLTKGSAVLTIGALEQMGESFKDFTDFIIKNKPEIVVNIEPLYELYDGNNMVDSVAMKYHKQRNYLMGYLPYLNDLASDGKIEIIKIRRMYFGSLFHDGWSILIWRPE